MNLLTKIVPFALIMIGLAGCMTDGTEAVSEVRGGEAAFRVSVPGMRTPSTRALDAAKEKEITAIDLVIFSNADKKIVEHHRIGAADIGVGTGGNDYQFTVKNIAEPENVTIAVIANASAEVAAALTAVGFGASKTAFLMALEVNVPAKWDTSEGSYRTIPMYGEVSITGSIYDAVEQSVSLTRMLAKVDVVNNIAPTGTPADGTFELTAVHVVNRNRAGLIAPRWNLSTGAPEPPPATAPNLPAAPDMAVWANGNELTYTLDTDQTSLEGEIYLFESAALSGDNPATSDGLRLVFEGNYTSGGVTKHYYYPVDFTAPDGAYMPVLRNHRYLFTITEAAGRGYDGLGEAVAAFGVMSNLRTSLVVVDESGIRHMVWNGEHFLGVSEKAFTVPVAGASDVALQIATNYADGWRASVENPADTWLTLGASSGSAADKTLTFSATLSDDEWTFSTATILLTAGRLETRVTVTQGEYKIAAEPANQYLLDGTTLHSFKVKSNTQWAVRRVSDPDNILLDSDNQIADMIENQSGGNNTSPGDDFTFTLMNDTDGSLSGKTFTVTFRDPTEKANDISVIVISVSCGCNGEATAMKIGNNYYLTHRYGGKCWMVQNSREVFAYNGIYVSSTIYDITSYEVNPSANGYYYTWQQASMANNACPPGWHLPEEAEFNVLVTEVNTAPDGVGKWWRRDVHGAFAGLNYGGWYSWGGSGAWWSGTASYQYYVAKTDDMSGPEPDVHSRWFSVRCVQDQ